MKQRGVAVLIFEPKLGYIVDLNDKACDLYGWDKETMKQKSVLQLNMDAPLVIKNKIAETLRNRHGEYRFRHRTAYGHVDVIVHAYASPQLIYTLIRETRDVLSLPSSITEVPTEHCDLAITGDDKALLGGTK